MRNVVLAVLFLGAVSHPFAGTVHAAGNLTPVVLTIKSSPNPSVAGREVTISAAVRIAGPAGTVVPSGSIEFFDGKTALGSAPIVSSQGAVTASLKIASFTAGSHPLIAKYSGDAHFASSASTPALHIVAPPPPQ